MNPKPLFPISLRFEDGIVESYTDVEPLETDLEVFDSNSALGCEVRDGLGRAVRLKIGENLILEELLLLDKP